MIFWKFLTPRNEVNVKEQMLEKNDVMIEREDKFETSTSYFNSSVDACYENLTDSKSKWSRWHVFLK